MTGIVTPFTPWIGQRKTTDDPLPIRAIVDLSTVYLNKVAEKKRCRAPEKKRPSEGGHG
jgi:hypothetical protein